MSQADKDYFAKMGAFFKKDHVPPGPPGNEVADEVIEHLFEWMRKPSGFRATETPRAPGRHASSLWKTCGRRHIIDTIFKPNYFGEVHGESKVLTTGLGHAMHDMWQKNYLGPSGLMFGLWKCLGCDHVTEGLMPLECPECGKGWKDYLQHREYFVSIPELNLCGHCDGVLVHPETQELYVFEFKSKSSSQFSKLKGPPDEHIWQIHAYMNGLQRKGLDIKGAVVVYMDKGKQTNWRKKNGVWTAGKKANVKQYYVEYDPVLWQAIIDVCGDEDRALGDIDKFDLRDVTYDIPAANKLAARYPRRCENQRCDLADDCQLREQCFSLDALEV